MKTSITDIAEEVGVSIATVSRALTGKGPVKASTRERILRAAVELKYPLSEELQYAARSSGHGVAVILPSLWDEFFCELLRGMARAAAAAGFHVWAAPSRSNVDTIKELLSTMSDRLEGAILMAPTLRHEVPQIASAVPFPIVLVNAGDELTNVPTLNIQNHQGAYAMTEHLIRQGHKRIGLIAGTVGNIDAEERKKGYVDALEAHGLTVDDELIVNGRHSQKGGMYGFSRLMSLRERPTAVFAGNDTMAMGAYDAAASLNLVIPDDVAVVGFDDVSTGQMANPSLTTVHVPVDELGEKAFSVLQGLINGDDDVPMRTEITTGVVVRGSCGAKK